MGRTYKKVCITLDEETLNRIDDISKIGVVNKSSIIRWAVKELYDKLVENGILKGDDK